MMKRIFTLFVTLVPLVCWAQTDDDFTPQTDFDAFQRQMEQRFTTFDDTVNARFANELQRQWTEFESFQGRERPVKPRPQVLPQADTTHHPHTSHELPAKGNAGPRPTSGKPWPQVPTDIDHFSDALSVTPDFYGQPVICPFPLAYADLVLRDVSETTVANGWKLLACDGYLATVRQCQQLAQKMQLNDWAIFELLKSCARQLFPVHYNEQTLFTIFMMNQLGYQARIGRLGQQLICLIPAQQIIYSSPYLVIDDTPFYIFNLAPQNAKPAEIYTYKTDFQSSAITLDLNIHRPMRFAQSRTEHTFTTKWRGEKMEVPVNPNVLAFYENYPVADLEVYANAHPEARWTAAVDSIMKQTISEMNEYEAVAALLAFLHKSFKYIYDGDQFGHEKYFFCEENFYYPGNDCEDRAVLFAYLVRRFVGAEVVLLDYPDHVATAVHFRDNSVSGDYIMHQGKKYLVCDPTYTGAEVGESMPNYQNVTANIIALGELE
ncbi:MAG: hypothetical protein MJZ70_06730 [Bacteroidales bacterium]|nr:hypothetical protein [Bacteroidales bacterium]